MRTHRHNMDIDIEKSLHKALTDTQKLNFYATYVKRLHKTNKRLEKKLKEKGAKKIIRKTPTPVKGQTSILTALQAQKVHEQVVCPETPCVENHEQ